MITCKITIKIKDYYPKIDTIPYENYICLFTCGEYEGQIPFLPDDSKIIQHQIKNITSDIKYKVHILDYNDMSLIGMCEMTISYQIINQISPPNGFIQEQQKKLLIDLKTKRKLFGTIVNIGDIYLNIFAEVFLVSRQSLEQKNINKVKKNLYTNTPQCYIKYNFQLNKSDYSPKSSKNKSSMINSNSEKHTLNSSKQDKCFTNKHSNNHNLINYKMNKDIKDKDNDDNKKTYSTFNNNIKKGFKNYSSRIQQKKFSNNNVLKEQNRKTIMDLLQQKKQLEKKLEKENSLKDNKSEDNEKKNNNNNENENNLINKKEGYLTEQNFNSNKGNKLENKYIINNHKLKKQNKDELKIYNNNNKIGKDGLKKNENDNKLNDNKKDENEFLENKEKNINKNPKTDILDNINTKNTLSPNINNVHKDEENDFTKNLSKTVKNNNTPDTLNNNYVYKSKNKMIKMGKAFSKNKFNNAKNNTVNPDNKMNRNINNTNTSNNINKKNILSTNQTENNKNINTTLLSTYSGDDDYLDIDRIILEKGADLRNDFQLQLKQYPLNNNYNNHQKNINSVNNRFNNKNNKEDNSEAQNYNDYNNNYQNNENNGIIGGTHFNMDTPRTEKMSQYSSTQSLNNTLTQENVRNNCLKLIEFYSLLNYKLKRINPKNLEIQKKLLIFKELFSTELKKSNLITNQSNLNQFIYNLSTNINGPLNEKILYLFPKIKKIESTIYQCLFDIYYTDEDVRKFKEYENYDEQTKIFLLLTVIKNLISKYGNISQIFDSEIFKKNILKQCLINYDLIEKEEGDKDYVNLEELTHEIKLKNQNEIKDYHEEIENKFRVIKEVDEDKEEENEEDEEEEIKEDKKDKNIENKENKKDINSNIDNKDNKDMQNGVNNNQNNDMDLNDIDIKDEEIIENILIEEFRKKYKDNKYFFEKKGLNEYLYNNIKIHAIIDKDGDIKIIVDDNNEEYYLDDFIKIFNDENKNESKNNNKENIKNDKNENENENENENQDKKNKENDEENIDIELNIENKDIIENVNNISDISNEHRDKKKENEEEENNSDYNDNNVNNENGMKKGENIDF